MYDWLRASNSRGLVSNSVADIGYLVLGVVVRARLGKSTGASGRRGTTPVLLPPGVLHTDGGKRSGLSRSLQ